MTIYKPAGKEAEAFDDLQYEALLCAKQFRKNGVYDQMRMLDALDRLTKILAQNDQLMGY